MDNILIINNVNKAKNKIEYEYNLNGKWTELLEKENKMFVEYSCDIEKVPESIAIIPFICNILPISFVFDLVIKVNEIDENFYNSIDSLRVGYQNMYPKIKMGGKLVCEKVVNNNYENKNSLCLFSGGVDAYNTLFQNIKTKPMLFTIWGADIKLNDYEGWNRVKKYHMDSAKEFNLDFNYVKSNFRETICYTNLSNYVGTYYKEEWWHGFQHGIGILGHTAPICYIKNIGTVFIASSFTANDIGRYTCASDPTIDNYLKFGRTTVIHDGYDFNRQQKIHNICKYVEDNKINKIDLRVCWKSDGGKNCCECEKCCRTILGILAEKEDPNQFGFCFNDDKKKKLCKNIRKYAEYSPNRYSYIQKRLIENYSIDETPKYLISFRKLNIKEKKPKYIVYLEKCNSYIFRVIKKIRKLLK